MNENKILGLTQEIWVLDIESRSQVDLKKRGQYIYWDHPSSQVLLTSARRAFSPQEPTYLWDFQGRKDNYPEWFRSKLTSPPEQVMFAAANCEFDRQGLMSQGIITPDEKWLDILVLAYILSFSGGLNSILKQVFPNVTKNPEGTRLITLFSTLPFVEWNEQPDKWEKFRQYCIQDTEVETRLLEWCLATLNQEWFQPVVHDLYRQELTYRRINRRGIPVDRAAVRGARAIRDTAIDNIVKEMRDITQVDNPNSRDQLLGWLNDNGYSRSDLTKESIQFTLDRHKEDPAALPEATYKILRLRQELGKSSNKKYDALDESTNDKDDRLRGGWQFYGASRTGRVAGRVLNPANLARPLTEHPEIVADFLSLGNLDLIRTLFPEKEIMQTLSSSIRASLKAPEGKLWCVADLTSIESVGAAWLAGCKTILNIFHQGRDTYRTFAAKVLNKDYEAVTIEERTLFKPVVLGGAYGLSPFGLTKYAKQMGVTIDLPEAEIQIAAFREEYHELVYYWHQLTHAAIKALKHPRWPQHAYAVSSVSLEWTDGGRTRRFYEHAPWPKVTFQYDGKDFLYCLLPSGRFLCYFRPRIDPNYEITMPDGHSFVRETVLYYGINQKDNRNLWQEINSYGPKWLENITQGICRDIMWHGLEQAENDKDLEVVGDVYDEIMGLCCEKDSNALERLIYYMTTKPPWLTPDFFLGADGYLAERYKKS